MLTSGGGKMMFQKIEEGKESISNIMKNPLYKR
jgi:hypothetical protein